MNSAIEKMRQLQIGLTSERPDLEAELTAFPSGSAMLDLRRNGRAFVMAFSPSSGFSVDELQPEDGYLNNYQYTFTYFEPAAEQMRSMIIDEHSPTLSLMVIQSADILAAKSFYSHLGLSFVEEQHGSGPAHFAATMGSTVLEIYPCQRCDTSVPMRIGFHVPSLDRTLEVIRKHGARVIREAKDSPWGRRAIVEDPDGNRVELSTSSSASPAAPFETL